MNNIIKRCEVNGCGKEYFENGYCSRHYDQMWRHGKIFKRTKMDKNEVIDCGDYYEICLYTGRGEQTEIARTKIDKDDLDKIKDYKLSLITKKRGRRYATLTVDGKTTHLHAFILKKIIRKNENEVDHVNTDSLDNRKFNLRFITHQQNQMNKKVKGYYWDKTNKRWKAQIKINQKTICLGSFLSELDAIKSRRIAELKYFGNFAYNFDKN